MSKWVVLIVSLMLSCIIFSAEGNDTLLGPVTPGPSMPQIWNSVNGQERANYLKAARLDACRNLCERLYGLRLLLQKKSLTSDIITSHTMVLTRGVKEVGEPVYFADGRIQVTVKLDSTVWQELLKSSPDSKSTAPLLKDINPQLTSIGYSAIADSAGETKLRAERAAKLQALKNLCNLIKVMASAGDEQAKYFLANAQHDSGITISIPAIIKTEFTANNVCSLRMVLPLPSKNNQARKITVSGTGRSQ